MGGKTNKAVTTELYGGCHYEIKLIDMITY